MYVKNVEWMDERRLTIHFECCLKIEWEASQPGKLSELLGFDFCFKENKLFKSKKARHMVRHILHIELHLGL